MPAIIQSLRNGVDPVVGASRDDLRPGDVVTLTSVGGASTWSWALVYAPEDEDRNPSGATLLGSVTGPGPLTFTVDNEGAYLIRLITDQALPSEDVQFVRLRALTRFGDLSLVAAGERRDGTGIIPVDVSANGWANDQNFNLNTLLRFIAKISASGRVIYVDANRGSDYSNPPNNPAVAEGYADFSSVNDAILAALSNPAFNGGVAPSVDFPMLIAVRPGLYVENVSFQPHVHVVGVPTTGGFAGREGPDTEDRSVVIRTADPGVFTHAVLTPNPTDFVILRGLVLENNKVSTNAVLRKVGQGTSYFLDTKVVQNNSDPTSGPCLSIENGFSCSDRLRLDNRSTGPGTAHALAINPAIGNVVSSHFFNSRIVGPSVARLNVNLAPTCIVRFNQCSLVSQSLDPFAFGVDTNASTTILEYCEGTSLNGAPEFIRVNPTASGLGGDVHLYVGYTRLGDVTLAGGRRGIFFNTTAITGQAVLETSSSEYADPTVVGAPPLIRRASTNSRSLFYNNSISGLISENVQDAIDELALGMAGPRRRVMSQPMLVAIGFTPPVTIEEYILVSQPTLTLTSAQVYLEEAMGLAAGQAEVDILAGPPGGLVSILTAPVDVGVLASQTLVNATLLGPVALGPGDLVMFSVTYLTAPIVGDGLVASVAGIY